MEEHRQRLIGGAEVSVRYPDIMHPCRWSYFRPLTGRVSHEDHCVLPRTVSGSYIGSSTDPWTVFTSSIVTHLVVDNLAE